MAKEKAPEMAEEKAPKPCTVTLKCGGSFTSHGYTFIKDIPVSVRPELAEKLKNTGFFEVM